MALIYYPTAPWGAGVGQYALHNFHAAEDLRAGETMRLSRGGEPFTTWPPLLPALLALGRSLGLAYPSVGLLINLVATFVTLYLGARLLQRWFGPTWLALTWLALMLLSPDLRSNAALVGSDPLFGALLVAGLYALLVYLEKPGRSLWVAALLIMLACLQRYIGVALAAAGCALLLCLPRELPLRVRARRALGFGLVAVLPVAAWLLRNRLLAHPLVEDWDATQRGLLDNARASWSSLRLLVGPDSADALRPGVLTALIALATCALVAARLVRRREPPLVACVAFCGCYTLFLIGVTTFLHTDPIGVRFLLPVYPLFVALMLIGAREVWTLLGRFPILLRGLASAPFALLIALHAFAAQDRSRTWIAQAREQGLLGLSTPAWERSELVIWLREHPLEGEIHSNLPELFLQVAGHRAHLLQESGPAGLPEGAWIVWVDLPRRAATEVARPAFTAGGPGLRVVVDLLGGCVLRKASDP